MKGYNICTTRIIYIAHVYTCIYVLHGIRYMVCVTFIPDVVTINVLLDMVERRFVRDSRPESTAAFIGHIRQITFNSKHYIDLAHKG